MKGFEVLLTSSPDREKLVSEIWFTDNMVAEIYQERDQFEIILYPNLKRTFNLDDFLEILKIGKTKLIDNQN